MTYINRLSKLEKLEQEIDPLSILKINLQIDRLIYGDDNLKIDYEKWKKYLDSIKNSQHFKELELKEKKLKKINGFVFNK